ncbi:type 1 fimbria chaperone FimC [Trabulsiella odontotermitis]|uniref:type 1 fimbria chaperone FimC n=1 Tax=Trabulsiella odontotermitis TaxID=379893 RepID=UPI0024B666C8|nr:type 1 fimbria chaperone FimC [Trabulsiella odontotermitis]WHP30259.1 type 1 fimbria chaperone FimC [Trabulsiella odontotermitis]
MDKLFNPGAIVAFLFFVISLPAQAAGGIALGATRVIYPADARQTSLSITNSNAQERYLINAWIENNNGQKEKTFAVTPPLFVSEANSENTLRIIYAGPPLPADRESLFWMNVKAIPSVNKENASGKNVLQLAILSRIKLFVRPANLPVQPSEALSQLTFSRAGNQLNVTNASPYYITLVNLNIAGKKLENLMVAPKNSGQVAIPAGAQGALSWQSVNDYGAITPARRVQL